MKYFEQLKDPRWQRKRLEILQRDNFQCRCCFDKENTLVVHHIKYLNGLKAWEYENENLITLCDDCHNSIHKYIENTKFHSVPFYKIYRTTATHQKLIFERFKQISEQQPETWGDEVVKVLTSMVIKEDEL